MKRKFEIPSEAEEAAIQRGIQSDPDNPEWSEADVARARPASEALGKDTVAALRRRGTQKTPLKAAVSLRLDADVVEALRASGPGWQGRANAALRKAVLG
jgi:uncharacterized protein (DUF4415 family)